MAANFAGIDARSLAQVLVTEYRVGAGIGWHRDKPADFTYLRFHGPTKEKYAGSYSDKALRDWADWIGARRTRLASIYAYFNNDIGGPAVQDAMKLRSLTSD